MAESNLVVSIRPVASADLKAILDIETTQFGVDAWNAEMVTAELVAPYNRYFAAVDKDDAVLGYGGISLAFEDADVHTIGVAEPYQRRGIGRALMVHMWETALALGVRRMFLEVREDNTAALGLYTSLGFESIGKRENYYKDGSAALVMRKLAALD